MIEADKIKTKRPHRLLAMLAAVVLAFEVALALSACPASAQIVVSNAGNDTPTCGASPPCATLQYVADNICPATWRPCAVWLLAGNYEGLNYSYTRMMSIVGNCNAPGSVVVTARRDTGFAFYAQDHATLTLKCLATSGPGLASRQYAVIDADNITFLAAPGTAMVAANEGSKINIVNPYINGGAVEAFTASDNSQLNISGTVTLARGNFDFAFLSASYFSTVTWLATVSGGALPTNSYVCMSSIIKGAANIPGANGPYSGNRNCELY